MKKLPFLKLLLPFIIGVFIGIYSDISWKLAIILFLGCIGVAFGIVKYCNSRLIPLPYRWLTLLYFLAIVGLGTTKVDTYRDVNRTSHFSNFEGRKYEIKVKDIVQQKYGYYRFKGEVVSLSDTYKVYHTSGNVLVYWDTALGLIPALGKTYWIAANLLEIPEPKNPNEFNYKEYLSYYNIYYKAYVNNANQVILSGSNLSWYTGFINGSRNWALSVFEQYLPEEGPFLVAQALVLGGKNNLDEEVKSYFARTGTLHTLAVSGLHVGIIFLLLGKLTSSIQKHKYLKYLRVVIILLGVWSYAFITGFSPSVQRASIMFSVFTFAGLIKGKTIGLNSLFASAFIMLIFNPFLVVNVGFQLSYAAVLGIMLIYQPLYKLFSFSFISSKFVHFWVDKAWSVLCVSLAAQAATFPISIFYFGQFPFYFMFSNLVIIPLIFLLVCLSLALLITSFWSYLAGIIAFIFKYTSYVVLYSVEHVSKLPGAFAQGLHIGFWQVVALYIILGFTIAWMHNKRLKHLKYALIFLVLFLTHLDFRFFQNANSKKLVVHSLKKNDGLSYITKNRAFLIADSLFAQNKNAQKFHLDPYFRKSHVRKIYTKSTRGRLAGFRLEEDTLHLLIHTTKYANLNIMKDFEQGGYTLLATRNRFTDTFFAQSERLVWKKSFIKDSNPSNIFHSLDSFAFQVSFKQ